MATRVIRACGKNSIILQNYDNFNFPMVFHGNVVEQLKDIKYLQSRNDDVLVSTYPKSGSHWVYNIVHMLQNKTNALYGTPEFLDISPVDTIHNRKSPRTFASHLHYEYIPEDLRLKKGKIIVTYRNPKDVCMSMFTYFKTLKPKMNPYRGDWDGFVNLFLEGNVIYDSWFRWIKSWEAARTVHNGEILYLQYEDKSLDLRSNIKKIADYIGKEIPPKLLDTIVESSTFRNMRDKKPENVTFFQDQTGNVYRNGEIGDWKNWFTPAQNDIFDSVFKDKMSGTNIKFMFTNKCVHFKDMLDLERTFLEVLNSCQFKQADVLTCVGLKLNFEIMHTELIRCDKMATRVIRACGKNSIILQNYDNFNFPMVFHGNVVEQLKDIKYLQCRNDDVLVSTYPKSVIYDSWFRWIKSWEAARTVHNGEILYLQFEDMILDLRSNIKKIADYIGKEIPPKLLDTIVESSTFRNMRDKKPENVTFFQDQTGNVYRNGEIGDWKNWFTPAQNDMFDSVFKDKMSGTNIKFMFTNSKL